MLYGKRPLHAVRVRGSVIGIAVDRAAALLQNRTEEVLVRHRLLEARHERLIRLLGLKAAEQTAQAMEADYYKVDELKGEQLRSIVKGRTAWMGQEN